MTDDQYLSAASKRWEEMTPGQRAFQDALAELDLAEIKLREAAEALPKIPATFKGMAEFAEPGYARMEMLEVTADKYGQIFHAYTNGWDSMSETGSVAYIVIDHKPYQLPDDLDWD
jgi:hypothetical protein